MSSAEDDDEYEYVYEDVLEDEAEDFTKKDSGFLDGGFGLGATAPADFSGGLGGLDIQAPAPGQGIFKNDGFDYLVPGQSLGRVKNRTWFERMTYETGMSYMTGAVGGGTIGLFRGYRAAGNTKYTRLKINSMLNHGSKLASGNANAFGVFGRLGFWLSSFFSFSLFSSSSFRFLVSVSLLSLIFSSLFFLSLAHAFLVFFLAFS